MAIYKHNQELPYSMGEENFNVAMATLKGPLTIIDTFLFAVQLRSCTATKEHVSQCWEIKI